MVTIQFVGCTIRNRARLILSLASLLAVVCAPTDLLHAAGRHRHLKSLAVATDQEQADYISHNLALFQIVDPGYSKIVLEQAVDFDHFRTGVNEWIENNRERWEQVQTFLEYCRNEEAAGRIGTDIDADNADVRWQLFLTNGPPLNRLTLPCKCEGGRSGCTVWTYAWPSDSINVNGKEISCQSLRGEDYPTMITRNGSGSFPEARPLWPLVQCSRFPTDQGDCELWFSIWVLGNELTRNTLDLAELRIQVDLFDSTQTALVGKAQCTANLQLLRGILEATDFDDRNLVRAMAYLGLAGVSAGTFYARVTVNGAPYNEGDKLIRVDIPEGGKISDLLLLEQSAMENENAASGIIRGKRNDLYDNPEGVYQPGAKLNLYAEVALPSERQERYEVQVSLLKIPDVRRMQRENVRLSEAVVVSDSLDQPFDDGAFGSTTEGVLVDGGQVSESQGRSLNLVTKTFRSNGRRNVVNISSRLSNKLGHGRYMLTLTITDPKSRSYYMTARRVIQIASRTPSF